MGEKKKVAMLFSMSFLPMQGRYLRTYNEAKTLVDNGYDVTMLAWDRDLESPEKEDLDGIHIERLRVPAGFQAGPIKNMSKILRFYAKAVRRLWKGDFDTDRRRVGIAHVRVEILGLVDPLEEIMLFREVYLHLVHEPGPVDEEVEQPKASVVEF